MDEKKQIDEESVEENGPLGGAIMYSLKRWTELTEFLHTPNVSLSNTECERTIKTIITHRKNSLIYKSKKGAHVGDVIQCLIVTCQNSQINYFKYLAWIQENKSQVKIRPEDIVPWKFEDKIQFSQEFFIAAGTRYMRYEPNLLKPIQKL